MRNAPWIAAPSLLIISMSARSATLPPDVRPNHWAAASVGRLLAQGILARQSDGNFHGDARVTRTETAIAVAKLGAALEKQTWKSIPSRPRAGKAGMHTGAGWKSEPVRRYALALALARFADYVANGLTKHDPPDKIGKSQVLVLPALSLPPSHPAYGALNYLAQNRMVQPGSPLLQPAVSEMNGAQLSRVLAELAAGVTDRSTDIGQAADGSTPDATFHKPSPTTEK